MKKFNQISSVIAPYGEELVDLIVPVEAFDELKAYASQLPSIQISSESVCDLEMLATGGFSPLDRFMGREDFQCVLNGMRLKNGHLFPIPITLSVEASPNLHLDKDIVLRNNEFELLGIMTVEEIYEWDRTEVANKVFGTNDLHHPSVAGLYHMGKLNISGQLQVLKLPHHFDFQELRLTPAQSRAKLEGMGQQDVVAYQPSAKPLLLNETFIEQVLKIVDGIVLLQPAVGMTKLGDLNHFSRIRILKMLVAQSYKPGQVLLSLLPLATRFAGHRETLWHALVHRNFGANQMIVNRGHASPSPTSKSETFYNPLDSQELVERYSQELGVKMVPGPEHSRDLPPVYVGSDRYGTGRRKNGKHFPDWTNQPEIAEILAETYLPRHQQGVCIWFTGLSGAGKSTTAEILTWRMLEHGRRVTVLDGDVVRTHLSNGLGFSKADRDTNVRRIGFVASELVRLGGVVICAVVSPYRIARQDVRNMVGEDHFVEVFVNTPLEVCEVRDVKGMYAKARRGDIKGFTGIDDPYEPPDQPEITLDTVNFTPQENAGFIIDYLIEQGFIRTWQKQIPSNGSIQ